MSNSNVFTEAIGGLGARLDAMTGTAEVQTVQIPMDEISAREQIRKRFDGDDSTIAELAESIKRDGQIQEIVVRPCDTGYEIIAGERRWRAMQTIGAETIRAIVRDADDEEARRIQLAENVHRLNLEQFELADDLAKQLKACGGSLAKLAKATSKSKGWLSKVLALHDIDTESTPQTARLVQEGISSDVEVLGAVKRLEKEHPEQAAQVVQELKEKQGEADARKIVKEAREKTKPSRERDQDKKAKAKKAESPKDLDMFTLLEWCWGELGAVRFNAQTAIDAMGDDVRKVERVLRKDFEAGCGESDPVHAMLYRVGTDMYGTEPGGGRLRVSAFLKGALSTDPSTFDLADILNSARVGR